jgi:amino-acid N-acetyltransferase
MGDSDIKPADLRGILRYVPQWRDHVFVIAVDAAVLRDDNFANVMQDIAVLWNLRIKVVLVYGLGLALTETAKERNISITDRRGEGPTDEATLRLAIEVSGTLGQQIMEQFTSGGLRCVITNAVRATEAGIIGGVDQQCRGKVEKIDIDLIRHLLSSDIVPILSPIAFSRDGLSLRLNSDQLGSDLAVALGASKLLYLTPHEGLSFGGDVILNMTVDELREALKTREGDLDPDIRGKAKFAVRTIEAGTPRVHIIDGRRSDALLTEIFDNVGIGTMIYGNDYASIRQAKRRDVAIIHAITQQAVENQSLRPRSRQEILRSIAHFYVYEIDQSIVGCVCLTPWDNDTAEIEAVYVQPFYRKKGVGKKLVDFAVAEAQKKNKRLVFSLSTQSFPFFSKVCGFAESTPSALPAARLAMLEKSSRNSRVLVKAFKS